jgi:hypothetical protein
MKTQGRAVAGAGVRAMTSPLDHLDQVSIFGRSALALFLILGANWAFTLIHILQE